MQHCQSLSLYLFHSHTDLEMKRTQIQQQQKNKTKNLPAWNQNMILGKLRGSGLNGDLMTKAVNSQKALRRLANKRKG